MELKLWMVLVAWFIWIAIFIAMWVIFKYKLRKINERTEKARADIEREYKKRIDLYDEFQKFNEKISAN